ncbi:MAG: 5-methyltetrahydropteroyltriglutamate--homocysteine methyltransferase [Myxococcota bacterium]
MTEARHSETSLPDRLLPTTLVGSYSQPDWLIDRRRLGERLPARVRARELWRVPERQLAEAQDDATILALHDQERAGIDIVTDGEMRRESYSNHFANALDGIDLDRPGVAIDRTGREVPVPRVAGEIQRSRPVEAEHVAFVREHTRRPIKITLPGPFTMTQQAQNDYYPDEESLALAFAEAVNAELRDLFAAGVDVVQLDEPYVQARPEAARRYAVPALDRALAGATGRTVLHVCFGYGKHVADKPSGYAFLAELDACRADEISIEAAQPGLDLELLEQLPSKRIHLGVLDLRDKQIETAELVADRIRSAFKHVPAERLVVAPDCGMKYLSRPIAFAKLQAMVSGAARVRDELS